MNIGSHATDWKFHNFCWIQIKSLRDDVFLFENVPPKSWTSNFCFQCCREVMIMIKTSKFSGKSFTLIINDHFATMFFYKLCVQENPEHQTFVFDVIEKWCNIINKKFPNFFWIQIKSLRNTKKYFENVPPKSWTSNFYFGCCCEVIWYHFNNFEFILWT